MTGPATLPLEARSRVGRRLSLVVPMHDEADGLDALFSRLDGAVATLGVEIEIVCVDDGSRDSTLEALRARAAGDRRLRVIAFSRNFGKEAALTAGIEAATGDMVVPLDADLQDPPELLGEFISLWEQGYDVVYGVRSDRSSDSFIKRSTARGFYGIFNALSDHPIPSDAGDFRLMDRQVVNALLQLPERNRFMKGLFSWVGFRQVGVPYARPAREAGASSWGYVRLLHFAVDGVTAFSTAPLRFSTLIGFVTAAVAVIYALGLAVRVLIVGRDVPGYASLMGVMLVGLALQMIALGVIGEYVGRIFQEVKGRPLYMVRDRIGFDD